MSANNDYTKDPVNSTVHETFAAISANQDFDLDDVIQHLKKLHDDNRDGFKAYFNALTDGMEKGEPVHHNGYSVKRLEGFVKCHNAILVAESMKKSGATTITLNPKNELMDQVIAKAPGLDFNMDNLRSMGVAPYQLRLAS